VKLDLLDNGLNIIAKRATIPAGTTMGRKCRIHAYFGKDNFQNKNILSGSTIVSKAGEKIIIGDEDNIEKLYA
jgi:glucose-1-phosphate adenylyltransferase